MTSGKCLHSFEDEENQVYAMDYDSEGARFVTAGKDTAVRVYDEATKTAIVTMRWGRPRPMPDVFYLPPSFLPSFFPLPVRHRSPIDNPKLPLTSTLNCP